MHLITLKSNTNSISHAREQTQTKKHVWRVIGPSQKSIRDNTQH